MDRAVLRIDRDDLRAALARGGDDELPGDDERLLVREREPLARDDSGVRRPQPHRSDQARDDDVGFPKRRGLFESGRTADDPAREAGREKGAKLRNVLLALDRDEEGLVFRDLPGQSLDRPSRRERDDPEPFGKTSDDVERRPADRPRGAENTDGFHRNH